MLHGNIKRIVLKVGSGVIAAPEGGLREDMVEAVVENVQFLKERGIEVILVSSGAVACGMSILGIKKKPSEIPKRQALASVGQAHLIRTYEKYFNRHGIYVGQVLLTRRDVEDRTGYLNAKNAINELLRMGIVPIINENDTVMVEEIKFGDNDRLSALVAIMMDADFVLMLSTVDGLYTADPSFDKEAKRISVVDCAKEDPFSLCCVDGVSAFGTGGMYSKLMAISQLASSGIPAMVVKGEKGIVKRVFEGEEVGTLFLPDEKRVMGKKKWIAFASHPSGKVVVDDGAYAAIVKGGKSLLPSGVVDVIGNFDVGAVVSCVTVDGREIARGLTNYSSEELKRIKGLKTFEIEKVLGYKTADEVIHRDNMVVCEGLAVNNTV
ncbi:glutamate 5-kinase [Thermosulfidibacter takaii ABI70S6]|uniref:Glutamate 5-kinase n=1 Tax=Thermosulfidibacter takaii (strain DSM 17441 / JCM 13301 / NBRC 103674 / ABI70S6) TaxID=1298851 RepID=A0A0S3QSM7_THET7|nr:glutamate 5-kinase [Thermosulfidibacter takaii ABI70S6]